MLFVLQNKIKEKFINSSAIKSVLCSVVEGKIELEIDSETGPICQINFYHNSASRHHKDEIIKLGADRTKVKQKCKILHRKLSSNPVK